jgi:hypothetical protein
VADKAKATADVATNEAHEADEASVAIKDNVANKKYDIRNPVYVNHNH